MQLAYSTYALQKVDPFEAVERVAAIGYEGLEIQCGDAWPTAIARFGGEQRTRLRDALRAAGFPPPVVMHLIALCAHDEVAADKTRLLADTCQFARDLTWKDGRSVVTTTLGEQAGSWEQSRAAIAERLRSYAAVAADHNVVIAVEAHVGQEMDSPEKARWLVEAVDHPNLRLNYDFSHFWVMGMDLEQSLRQMAEYSVHTHIKDGAMVDGKVQFALPGEGRLDLVPYLRAVQAAGLQVPITVEVSAQIWGLPDYDPWPVAERCFVNIDRARREAGV